jgi:hypothetical protein
MTSQSKVLAGLDLVQGKVTMAAIPDLSAFTEIT